MVSIHRIYYCDAPDCGGHARTFKTQLPMGMLRVSQRRLGGAALLQVGLRPEVRRDHPTHQDVLDRAAGRQPRAPRIPDRRPRVPAPATKG